MQTIPTEAAIARKFRLDCAPTILAREQAASPTAFSRLRAEGACRGRTMAVPPEQAFSFMVALAPMPAGEIWIDGKYATLPPAAPGDTFAFDLAASRVANLTPSYDFVRFYVPLATLDQVVSDQGVRRAGGLRPTSQGTQDPAMHGLAQSILAVVQEPAAAPALFVDAIALALHTHVARAYGDVRTNENLGGAGLAPWQLRRAQTYIEAHVEDDPSVSNLARECRLSASHFGRAFRQSTGMQPHQYLTRRRIERAKELLLEGDMPLAQIALASGFVDQNHLTRSFTRHEGHAPGKWRRLHFN